MRTTRIILQVIIALMGGLFIIASVNSDWVGVVFVVWFFGFLFALTFALKEETETRAIARRKLNFKPMGVALLLLGAFGIFAGARYWAGLTDLPDGSGSCRAICGLILLAIQLFGEAIGRLVAGFLCSFMGVFLCYMGYRLTNLQAN